MVKYYRYLQLMICAVVVLMFVGCTATAERESAGEYVDDTVITTKVKAAMVKEESLKAAQINVETFKTVVQLSGFVDSAQNVAKAGEVARSVKGVTSVKNDLLVK
ncbi:MAG: BON domain-containing protein [Desulfuromonadales bacterium]|nr:BON domain-containing protein [Desulfuromonadales bacterium]